MQDKKTDVIYLRLPGDLRNYIRKRARKNMRTETQELQLLIEHGLNCLEYIPGEYKLKSKSSQQNLRESEETEPGND